MEAVTEHVGCGACELTTLSVVVRNNKITVTRCGCGEYWIMFNGVVKRPGEVNQALIEIIESLRRLKLPVGVR